MIPIGDSIPTNRFPSVTYALIALNVLVFLYELTLGPNLPGFFETYGFIPGKVTAQALAAAPGDVGVRFFGSMFIHGNWLHLGGNMLYLWIFGDNVEDSFGHARFLGFYFLAGLLAMTAHTWSMPLSDAPTVGASGAIAGILGAYLVMFPRARIYILIPLFIIFPIISVPAVLALGFWFFEQLTNGIGVLGGAQDWMNVAWWTHIGGFIAGMLLVVFFREKRTAYRNFRF